MRTESDSLGSLNVPKNAYYGVQTQRARTNFPISNIEINQMPDLIVALAMVKKASALTNKKTKAIPVNIADAIIRVCDEIIAGELHDSFIVDAIQGGAGTSTNMNANEVIANRALEILGEDKGNYQKVHPNDHVNCSQSTNDAYATAVRLSLYFANQRLMNALTNLSKEFALKAHDFSDIEKLGRTQLQDAVPMDVGSELNAFAITIDEDIQRAREIASLFLEVNLGGTAIGSGVGASADYLENILNNLQAVSGLKVKRSTSLYEASWDMGAFVLYSGMIKRIAVKLSKIANDLRLLSSGPRGGIGEYILPSKQPGSSIMPGKVNPVIPEVMNQVCFKAFGADTTVTFAAEGGQLQLNAFEPVIVQSLSEVIEMLINAANTLSENCVAGLEINREHCQLLLMQSSAMATRLVPHVGYEKVSNIAKNALQNNTPFMEYLAVYHHDLLKYLS